MNDRQEAQLIKHSETLLVSLKVDEGFDGCPEPILLYLLIDLHEIVRLLSERIDIYFYKLRPFIFYVQHSVGQAPVFFL